MFHGASNKQKADPRYPYHLHEQREIDALVYELYGLTEDDIREVTLWYCRRYDKLAAAQGVTADAHARYASKGIVSPSLPRVNATG